ncbi:MAG: hypothetical protein HYU37_02460 [Acidobacteria bacterium]|nr:hypothetical protein [Acidobacteriota bacterium]
MASSGNVLGVQELLQWRGRTCWTMDVAAARPIRREKSLRKNIAEKSRLSGEIPAARKAGTAARDAVTDDNRDSDRDGK